MTRVLQQYKKLIILPAAAALAIFFAAVFKTAPSSAQQLMPLPGAVFETGDTVTVSFSGPGLQYAEGTVFTIGTKMHVEEGPGPYEFKFPLSQGDLGHLKIAADSFGKDSRGRVSAATYIIISSPQFVSLRVEPPEVYFVAPIPRPLLVIGEDAAGKPYDLTANEKIHYSTKSATDAIVSVSDGGFLTPHASGTDTIIVTYPGHQVEVPVTVEPGIK